MRHRFRLVSLALLFGIAATPAVARREKINPYAPTLAPELGPAPLPANGAIFQTAMGYAPLTSGARAAMVGDVITIYLVERTQSSKTNSANYDRGGSIGIQPPPTGPLAFFKASDTQVGATASFAGKGAATQANQLSGAISVTIAEVYPNGTMLIRGEKRLTLNRGDEMIRISGIVRAVDIGPDNAIPSTRVADARITYTGKGEIARASSQGWLGRFFSRVSPF